MKVKIGNLFAVTPSPTPDPQSNTAMQALEAHLADTTPHPIYDNLADGHFVTYFRNGLA